MKIADIILQVIQKFMLRYLGHSPDQRKGICQRKSLRIYLFSSVVGMLGLGLGGMATESRVQAAELTNWTFNSQTNQLEIILEDATTPRYFLLSNPPRLVLDLPNTKLGNVEIQQNYSGVVRQVRTSQFTADITRIVLEFAPETQLSQEQIELIRVRENRWQLRTLAPSNTVSTSLAKDPPLPPASFYRPPRGVRVQVPPLRMLEDATAETAPPIAPTTESPQVPIIEFGQPLPGGNTLSEERIDASGGGILKAGMQIPLQYVGATPLTLLPGKIIQEVLLLSEAIRDENQQIIIPAQTPIIGRFETNENGSYFISQALVLDEGNILLNARSNRLEATETEPQPLKIEPGFILQVQLTQDLQY